jgi:hypothetical protein
MFMLAVNHQVEDYERWKSVFDEVSPREGGAAFHRVNRLVDSPNTVTVVVGFATAEAANTFLSAPDDRSAMERSGVVGEPRVELYEEVEAVEY